MKTNKKVTISAGWVAVSVLLGAVMYGLRHIGTTWTDEPGFIRVLVLLFLAILPAISLALAVLVWVGRPKHFYEKLVH